MFSYRVALSSIPFLKCADILKDPLYEKCDLHLSVVYDKPLNNDM